MSKRLSSIMYYIYLPGRQRRFLHHRARATIIPAVRAKSAFRWLEESTWFTKFVISIAHIPFSIMTQDAGLWQYQRWRRCAILRSNNRSKVKKKMAHDKQDGRKRNNIQIGKDVEVVQKRDQRTGVLTRGVVQRILTKSVTHPHGIKVRLESGEVGRVKNVLN